MHFPLTCSIETSSLDHIVHVSSAVLRTHMKVITFGCCFGPGRFSHEVKSNKMHHFVLGQKSSPPSPPRMPTSKNYIKTTAKFIYIIKGKKNSICVLPRTTIIITIRDRLLKNFAKLVSNPVNLVPRGKSPGNEVAILYITL